MDGSIEPGLAKKRMIDSMGRGNIYKCCQLVHTLYLNLFTECDSEGRLIDTDKWDNHNTIARGWITSGEDHYQPVTFRKIYGAKNQPIPPSPIITTEVAQTPTNNTVPVDYPEEECAADL